MKLSIISCAFASALLVIACGGSDGGGDSDPDTGSAPSSTTPSGSSEIVDKNANCGTSRCDAATEYCALDDNGDGWKPRACVRLPLGAPLPKPASECPLPTPEDCGFDPSRCQSAPDTSACDGTKTCDVLKKLPNCPQSGAIATRCSVDNGLVGFGCGRP